MLVDRRHPVVSARFWKRLASISLALMVLSLLSIAPYLTSSTELVRLRNAMVLEPSTADDFLWSPENIPVGFRNESSAPDPFFTTKAEQLGLNQIGSDWGKVLAISSHLLENPKPRGPPIQSDLKTTYDHIVNRGEGYCGDYTRVFMAFAIAAHIPVRAWAFSFDGFGGHGHIWPEIWNRELKRWQLISTFNNGFFHRGDGVAISALELRRAMFENPRTIRFSLLHAEKTPGFVIEEKLWDYVRRGIPEWYLLWGNDVYTYDRTVARLKLTQAKGLSHALEQLGAIVTDAYPHIKILETAENERQTRHLWYLRWQLFAVALICLLASVGLAVAMIQWLRNRRMLGRHT